MTNSEIEANINFQRALYLLENRISDPGSLFIMWRMLPCQERVPQPEVVRPWHKGLEDLIK